MNDDLIDDSAPAPTREVDLVRRGPVRREIEANVDATESKPSTAMPVFRDLDTPGAERERRRTNAVDRLRHERAMRNMRRFTARGRSV